MTEEQDSEQVEDDVDATDQEPESPETDDEDGFDGEFDAKRARRTIDKLRNDLKAAKSKASAPADTEESAAVKAENLRLRVALKSGLDDDLADRLRGNTEDELLADAQKLLDRFYPESKKGADTRPARKPAGGTRPREEPELSAEDIVSQATSR